MGSTRRMSTDAPVEWTDALHAWAAAARPVLVRAAATYNAFLTYQDLAEAVQEEAGIVTRVPFRHWIGTVLGQVASDLRPGEPLLTALVVTASGHIGDGYSIPVIRREGVAPVDLDMHAANERLACYRYFGAVMPPDGGKPTLTPRVAEKRRARRPTASRRESRRCPSCFLELPATGVCGNCVS